MHKRQMWEFAALIGAAVAASGPAAAADAEHGASVFNRCKACHVADKETNRVGPHLVGIIGRKAGSLESFSYSQVMRTRGEEGLTWNAETLSAYLADPRGYLPGNRMAFAGMKNPDDLADLVAWFESLAAE